MGEISDGVHGRFLKRALANVAYQSDEHHERQRTVAVLLREKERFLTAKRGCCARILDGLAHRLASTGRARSRNVHVICDGFRSYRQTSGENGGTIRHRRRNGLIDYFR